MLGTVVQDGAEVAIKKIAKARFMNDAKRAQKYLNVFSAEVSQQEIVEWSMASHFLLDPNYAEAGS